MKRKLNKIIILSDGIRGHFHQSLGVAKWIERIEGVGRKPAMRAEIKIIEVPKFSGLKKFLCLKLLARFLKLKNKKFALIWLKLANFNLDKKLDEKDFLNKKILFISAGSSAAPFCLALASLYDAKSAVIMTPSVLGIKNFDFAIIPEHDRPKINLINLKNYLTTLGAPNHIYKPELKIQAENFFKNIKNIKDKKDKKIIALLIGGSDANYDVNLNWAENVFLNLLKAAEEQNAVLLITTSRRTGKSVDDKIANILNNNKCVKYFLAASREPEKNPVPAMLGAATHVIATEDSVSMVSEAATAGFRVGLLRTDKKRGLLTKIKNFTGGGTARFDKLFDNMINKDIICDLGVKTCFDAPDFKIFSDFLAPEEQKTKFEFNEAERAARWILERL